VHVVWDLSNEVLYGRRMAQGSWEPFQSLSGPINLPTGYNEQIQPQIQADAQGRAHVLWYEGTGLHYAVRSISGNWSEEVIAPNQGGNGLHQFVVEPNGQAHVIWSNEQLPLKPDDPPNSEIYYAVRTPTGQWLSPKNVSADAELSSWPQIGVDALGNAHLIWGDTVSDGGVEIHYRKRLASGEWLAPQNLASSGLLGSHPTLAVASDGGVHIAVNGSYYFAPASNQGLNGRGVTLSADPFWFRSAVALSASGTAHVAWTEAPANWCAQIYHAGVLLAETTGDVSAAQTVTVPGNLPNPGLSFVFQLGGAAADTGSGLAVLVDDGQVVQTVYSSTTSAGQWTRVSAPLSDWSGQTITLTLKLHAVAGTPVTWANIDDVTLGSVYPDLFVQTNATIAALPGDMVHYQIAYGNQGGSASSAVRLIHTLPPGIDFAAADLTPLSIDPVIWDLGSLPAHSGPNTLIVTATVKVTQPGNSLLPASTLITGSTELELANNLSETLTWVGSRSFMPLIWR
jgi:uncharacterized repeat protein (TIGR01451 family)